MGKEAKYREKAYEFRDRAKKDYSNGRFDAALKSYKLAIRWLEKASLLNNIYLINLGEVAEQIGSCYRSMAEKDEKKKGKIKNCKNFYNEALTYYNKARDYYHISTDTPEGIDATTRADAISLSMQYCKVKIQGLESTEDIRKESTIIETITKPAGQVMGKAMELMDIPQAGDRIEESKPSGTKSVEDYIQTVTADVVDHDTPTDYTRIEKETEDELVEELEELDDLEEIMEENPIQESIKETLMPSTQGIRTPPLVHAQREQEPSYTQMAHTSPSPGSNRQPGTERNVTYPTSDLPEFDRNNMCLNCRIAYQYFRFGKLQNAMDYLEKALEENSYDAVAAKMRDECYRRLRR